jgi:sugar diacid utilization regulator
MAARHRSGTTDAENLMAGSRQQSFDPDVWVDALSQLAVAANVTDSGTALLDRVAAVTCRLTGFDFGAVLLADTASERLLIEGFAGLDPGYVSKVNSQVPLQLGRQACGAVSPSCQAFTTAVPVWVADLQTDAGFSQWSGLALEQGYHTLVAVPLRVGETIAGTLNCYSRTTRQEEKHTVRIVVALADYAGAAIQMSRLRSTAQRRLDELVSVNEQLRDQKQQLERMESIHSELTHVAVSGGKLPDVANALSKALDGYPVRIEDADGELLAYAAEVEHPRADVAGVDPEAPGRLTVPVSVDGEAVARISTGVAAAMATMLQRQALEHAATVCAMLLCQDRLTAVAEARFLGDLVGDLVSGQPDRLARATERARRAGYNSTIARRVVVVRPLPDSRLNQPIALQGLAQRLAGDATDVLVGSYGSDLLLLWPEPMATPDPGLAETLRRWIRPADAVAVIGQRCAAITEYARAYRIARGAVGLSRAKNGGPSVVALSDLGVYELLLQLDDSTAITRFSDATLAPARDYDRERGTDLVHTLRVYFNNACHTEATAQALFIHANTVNLRLRRIEKLLSVSLARPADLLKVSAALMADDVVRNADEAPSR